MRYIGQGHEIVVPLPERELVAADAAVLREAFEREYRALFSRTIPHAEVEILTWTLTVSTSPGALRTAANLTRPRGPCAG